MDTIDTFLDAMFAPYPSTPRLLEAKGELRAMMEDKQQELMDRGHSEAQAVGTVIRGVHSGDHGEQQRHGAPHAATTAGPRLGLHLVRALDGVGVTAVILAVTGEDLGLVAVGLDVVEAVPHVGVLDRQSVV